MAEPGDIVGQRYEIIRKIAAGGMGTVYEARHTLSHRAVALKVLHSRVAQGDANRQRFLREVSAPAHIGHDGIVEVFDAGFDTEDGSLFVAMELLHGETLTQRIENGQLMHDQILDLFEQFLDPLAAAHAKGFVHRDLKPDNVYVARQRDGSERLKILDFGIAREADSINVTMAGTAMGTPDFMSPEQATNARDVTSTSDVWAVGVMLYWALARKMPFAGNTASAIVLEVLTRPAVPVEQLDPSIPRPIADLVNRCLAKEPSERPLHAGALLEKLREARRLTRAVPPTMAAPELGMTTPFGGGAGRSTPGPGPYQRGPLTPGTFGDAPAAGPTPAGGSYGAPPGSSPGTPATPLFGGVPAAPTPSPPLSMTSNAGAPSAGEGGSAGWWIVGGLLVVALIGASAVVGWIALREPAAGGGNGPASASTGHVRLATDVQDGLLFVDGTNYGPATTGQLLELPPGAHALEVRVGTTSIARQDVTLLPGGLQDVSLNRPMERRTGTLGAGDHQLSSGEYVDEYMFNWPRGATVRVEALSTQFDTYLILKIPSGTQQDNDDPGQGSTNALLELVTPEAGTYQILVTSYRPGEAGAYELLVTAPPQIPATP